MIKTTFQMPKIYGFDTRFTKYSVDIKLNISKAETWMILNPMMINLLKNGNKSEVSFQTIAFSRILKKTTELNQFAYISVRVQCQINLLLHYVT